MRVDQVKLVTSGASAAQLVGEVLFRKMLLRPCLMNLADLLQSLVVDVYSSLISLRAGWHLVRPGSLLALHHVLDRPLVSLTDIGLPYVFVKRLVVVAEVVVHFDLTQFWLDQRQVLLQER